MNLIHVTTPRDLPPVSYRYAFPGDARSERLLAEEAASRYFARFGRIPAEIYLWRNYYVVSLAPEDKAVS
jgi:hypothetical protein